MLNLIDEFKKSNDDIFNLSSCNLFDNNLDTFTQLFRFS